MNVILLHILHCIFILLLATANFSYAQGKEIVVESGSQIQASFQYLEDSTAQYSIDDIVELPSGQWEDVSEGSANFGMTQSPYWLRFTVRNSESNTLNLIAELEYSQLDDVRFFVFLGRSNVHQFYTGDGRAFYPREVDHPNMFLRFNLEPEQAKTIYVRVQTNGSMILPLSIWRENNLYEAIAEEIKFHFFYYGSLTVIILINFAVFLTLREKLYLYYALAISGYLLFFASILGFSFQHIYPQYPEVHSRALLSQS